MNRAIRRTTNWNDVRYMDHDVRSPDPEKGPWRIGFTARIQPWESPCLQICLWYDGADDVGVEPKAGRRTPVKRDWPLVKLDWNLVTGGDGQEWSRSDAFREIGSWYEKRSAPMPNQQVLADMIDLAVETTIKEWMRAVSKQFGAVLNSDDVREIWGEEDARRVMAS